MHQSNLKPCGATTLRFSRVIAVCRQARCWLGLLRLWSVIAFLPVRADVSIYEDVFEILYALGPRDTIVECHAYGPWGAPSLSFLVESSNNGNTETTTLTALDVSWPGMELVPYEDCGYDAGNYDCRAAWIVTTGATILSISNTVYASSVFKNECTGRYIPEVPYTFTGTPTETKTLYLCFGHPNGTTLGWMRVRINGFSAQVDRSCIATGVISLRAGTTRYVADPVPLLLGGIRQQDIFVDAAVAVSGSGLSWESPFKSIQEAADAVRLDGTTVHVKPGVYGPVTVDNTKFTANNLAYTFTVQSTDGPEKTIIDGGEPVNMGTGSSWLSKTCFSCGDTLYDRIKGFTLRNARYGVQHAYVERCIVSNCWYGLYHTTVNNSLITGNKFSTDGSYCNDLRNCTVAGNYEITPCWAANSIIWGFSVYGYTTNAFKEVTNCCVPAVGRRGAGCITNDPGFVDAAAGDYRLRPDSPCINAGASAPAVGTTDLLGGMRVRGGGVDIGCFEFVSTVLDTNVTHGVTVPPEWLEAHYGLDRSTSSDSAYQAAALAETANTRDGTAEGGMLSAWESYVWDLDPADSNQFAYAEIIMTNGAPHVCVSPASANRTYTLLGKPSLDAGDWARTQDFSDAAFLGSNRFFKVSVELK